MNIDFPIANVACRCGQLLYDWKEVVKHWTEHRAAKRAAEEYQAMIDEQIKRAPR